MRCKLLALLRCLAVQRVAVLLALALSLGCHRPELIAHDGTAVPVPHNLAQAMDALDQLLEPELIEALRSGQVDPIGPLFPQDFYEIDGQAHIGHGLIDHVGPWPIHPISLAEWFRIF